MTISMNQKSRRALEHRTARLNKKRGVLQHRRETPTAVLYDQHLSAPAPKPEQAKAQYVPEKKPGVFRRIFRRITGK